jgi:hypothetical protein
MKILKPLEIIYLLNITLIISKYIYNEQVISAGENTKQPTNIYLFGYPYLQ